MLQANTNKSCRLVIKLKRKKNKLLYSIIKHSYRIWKEQHPDLQIDSTIRDTWMDPIKLLILIKISMINRFQKKSQLVKATSYYNIVI